MKKCLPRMSLLLALCVACQVGICFAQEKKDDPSTDDKAIVGLIPKAPEGLKLDGKLDEWDSAFVTPVHVGHPDYINRGAHVLFLWDDDSLYIGLRCLDRKPNHTGSDNQVWNGDAVEFYLDTRRGGTFGGAEYRPGTLHMFYTPFTAADVKPRTQVRDIPAFKSLKLQGAEVAAEKAPWGYTAEFKLPWANFPAFTPDVGEVVGIDCELCSSDGGARVDRAFVYSSPAAVGSPATLGRVRLVDRLNPKDFETLGRALLPLNLAKSGNYDWLYGTVCVSPTIEKSVAKLEARIVDSTGTARKTTQSARRPVEDTEGSGFALWRQRWELFDLPPGEYTVELTALDKESNVITSRKQKFLHEGGIKNGDPKSAATKSPPDDGDSPPPKKGEKPPPKKKTDDPPPKKTDEPTPPKKTDEPKTGKKDDKSPLKKEGDKPDPGDLPKAEPRPDKP